ncbi:TonB-dependent receptor [Asticcacaulis sp. W401b]|uniref:TonB-dependent receptor n=1 Tax=Asticcacaulis sp. W401b TaxID=3388666 RepID=UPI003970AA83
MADALTAIGRSYRVNIVFPPSAVVGRRSGELKGNYSLDKALERALGESGLVFARTEGGSYMVREPLANSSSRLPMPPSTVAAAVPSDEIPLIVVTGFRNSLVQSLQVKRAYAGVLDSIVAEDIAKFPDNNLAEAMQRMPGVAVSRDQGEGRSISVRGLGPDFTRVEINGVEAQAATDGLTYGVNKGRGFDFNVFPAELFGRVDVRKTSSADLPEGSLGATVNLMTPKPFDKPGFRLAGGIQGSYSALSQRYGSRATLLIGDNFRNDALGILFSASVSHMPLEVQGVHSGGWNQGTGNGGFCIPTAGTGGLCDVAPADLAQAKAAYALINRDSTYHPQFYRYTNSIGEIHRFGVTGSVQWRPTGRLSLSLDLLYSDFHTRRRDYYLEAIGFSRGLAQGGKPETVARAVEVDENSAVTYGLFDNVDVRSEVTVDEFRTRFGQGALQMKYKLSDAVSFSATLGASRSDFDNGRELTVQIDRFNVDGYSFDTRQGGQGHPKILYGFDVTDPSNWYFGPRVVQPGGTGGAGPEIRLRPNFLRNDYDIFKIALSHDRGARWRFDGGFELKRYGFRSVSYRFDGGEANFPLPANGLMGLTELFCGLGVIAPPEGTPRCWVVPKPEAFAVAYDLYANSGRTAASTTNVAARGQNQSVIENDQAVFAKLHFRTNLAGRPLSGDVGVRAVRTRQASEFYSNVPTDAEPDAFVLTRVARTYSDVLPSFNATWRLSDEMFLRIGTAKVMARPPLGSLAAATAITVSGARRLVTTGNPFIEPIRAVSYDLGWEWYPSTDSTVSVALFYKDISTYIQNLTYVAPFAATGLPESLLANTGVEATDDFHVTSVVNTPGGPLKGLEFNYQHTFKTLPQPWSGLGVKVNYTYAHSRIDYLSGTPPVITSRNDLINLSRHAYSVTGFYELGPVQFRVSSSYRDRYLINVPGSFNTDSSGTEPATYWDFSASYALTPQWTLSLEGLNLTSAQTVTWDRSSAPLLAGSNLAGRQIYMGLRFRR